MTETDSSLVIRGHLVRRHTCLCVIPRRLSSVLRVSVCVCVCVCVPFTSQGSDKPLGDSKQKADEILSF